MSSQSYAEFDVKYTNKIVEMAAREGKIGERTSVTNRQTTIATFYCQPMSASNGKPKSVHALRPADIEVVAAIGDSLTVSVDISMLYIV